MLVMIKKLHQRLDNFMAVFSAGLVLLMTAGVVADVLGRKFFHRPIAGVNELASFTMAAIAFFTLAYVQSVRGHISLSMFFERLPKKAAASLDIFFLIALFAISFIVGWQGGRDAIEAWQAGDVTLGLIRFPLGPAKMVVPVGCGLLCLRLFSQICESIARFGKKSKNEPSPTSQGV